MVPDINKLIAVMVITMVIVGCSTGSTESVDLVSSDAQSISTKDVHNFSEFKGFTVCHESSGNSEEMMCTLNYDPVCGITANGALVLYSNDCMACFSEGIIGHVDVSYCKEVDQ